ncbi:MAG: hypothetical protein GOMPHAMPRED_000933 [Gomphillus americanus]|uniref:Uncharacterized protein n=1 Tax=Gomphillus americanus TaxID=1940652 RepID=A0A8H3F0U0_9LECA|nr:MAG: hypothetical protein GOMPHAMPRED_000933 [Gomphillus americanus]
MLVHFQAVSFAIAIASTFTFAQSTEAIHGVSTPPITPPLQHEGALLEPRKAQPAGPPAVDWRGKAAPKIFCTPSVAKEVRIVGVAVLKERVDKGWLTGDSTSVQLLLYDHACRLLNQTVIGAQGYKNYDNFVRWDMDRNSAVSLTMDTMPTYQSAGYCPGGYNCTRTPSYWSCGPPASKVPTTTCSITKGRLNIKTFAWGSGGNTRDQYSDIWVSSAIPKDACDCHGGSAANGLPTEYVYGCQCHIDADMSVAMSGEVSTGCREEERIGYCPADPDPYAFEPAIPPPWVNSPGRFRDTTAGPEISTPVVHGPTKSTVCVGCPGWDSWLTGITKGAFTQKSGISLSHTLSFHNPHKPSSSASKAPSLKSSATSKHTSATPKIAKHSSNAAPGQSMTIKSP